MASYGYSTPKYGTSTTRSLSTFSPLAKAASGAPTVGDPFGLLTQSPLGGNRIDGGIVPTKSAPTTSAPQAPVATPPPTTQGATNGYQNQANPNQAGGSTAPAYDLHTDPALQAVNAYTGMSDEQAQALYDKQRRDEIIQSGLTSLAQNLFPGDKNLAEAAAKNPTSTKATLTHQRDLSQHDLLDQLTTGGHNLGYSGYRTTQEGELGRQFENALAQAAAGVQSDFGQYLGALNGTKSQNAQARASALGDAYNRQLQYFLNNPPTGNQGGTDPNADPGGITDPGGDPTNILQALIPGAFASRTRRFAA